MPDNQQMQSINQRIAERVGKELVDLIPPEQWQEMIDKEIQTFKNVTAPNVIKELLLENYKVEAKKAIDAFTLTDEYCALSRAYTSKALREFIGASSGAIFAAALTPSMQYVLQDLRNRLGYG